MKLKNISTTNSKYFWWLIAFVFIFRLVFSFVIWHPDLNNHADWGIRFFEYGANKFYAPESNVWSFTWPNQPPGTVYMFAGMRVLFEFIFNIFWQININISLFPSLVMGYLETNLYPAILKLPAIFADFGIAYLIYKWTSKKWASLLWLINPVVWYNSTIWGQYDSVINFLALLSFYLLNKKNLLLAVLAFVLSIYTKASLLIFAPIFLIIMLRQKYNLKSWFYAVSTSILTLVLLTLPFSNGNVLVWLYELYSKKIFVEQLHVITANAFNLWTFISGIHEKPDSLPFVGLTYQIWGYILFAVSYIPLLLKVFRNQSLKNITWVLGLTAFSSFALLTNMHERYIYPLFPYLTILLAYSLTQKWIYWSITTISLMGMYNFWFTPRIEGLVSFLSFGDRLMPRILGLIMLVLFLIVYKRYNESRDYEK